MSADERPPRGAPVHRGPVFDLPSFPDDGSGARHGIVRIVDPAGLAVAWFSAKSARCVAFMVRSVDRGQATWLQVFGTSQDWAADERVAGCDVLAVLGDAVSPHTNGELASDWACAEWRVVQRDPTSITLHTMPLGEVGADPRNVEARLVAQLEDASLSLTLTVQNDGAAVSPVALGLRAVFPPEFGSAFQQILVRMEGKHTPLHLSGDEYASSDVEPRLVVTCDEGMLSREPHVDTSNGSLEVVFLSAPAGQHVHLLPGAFERVAISIALNSGDGQIEGSARAE